MSLNRIQFLVSKERRKITINKLLFFNFCSLKLLKSFVPNISLGKITPYNSMT